MLALAAVLPTLANEHERINAVERDPVITQLGRDENGHFVWQLSFTMHCNIRE